MASNIAKAAIGALALNGGGNSSPGGEVDVSGAPEKLNTNENDSKKPALEDHNPTSRVELYQCPCPPLNLAKYHQEDACLVKSSRPFNREAERQATFNKLDQGGAGASLVPNQHTVVCPLQVNNLASPSAVKGFDTTWIVENTSLSNVVVAWVVDGIEWSPFTPDVKPIDDPKAILKPGQFASIPTFESFIYHVREIEKDGPGKILLQHRVGMVAMSNPNQIACDTDTNIPDIEPVNPETAERVPEFKSAPRPAVRQCNTIGVGFRNQAGCPLHIYWARGLTEIPNEGFSCGEEFRFHMGTKPATQHFMNDWESTTKYEGTFIGHTFVARLASDPNIVVDSYRVEPTKVVDCPSMKQQVTVSSQSKAEAIMTAEGTVQPLHEENIGDNVAAAAAAMAGTGAASN